MLTTAAEGSRFNGRMGLASLVSNPYTKKIRVKRLNPITLIIFTTQAMVDLILKFDQLQVNTRHVLTKQLPLKCLNRTSNNDLKFHCKFVTL